MAGARWGSIGYGRHSVADASASQGDRPRLRPCCIPLDACPVEIRMNCHHVPAAPAGAFHARADLAQHQGIRRLPGVRSAVSGGSDDYGRADIGFTLGDGPNGGEQLVELGILEQVAASAGLEHLGNVLLVGVHG
jgi:hypothetical protein